LTNKNNSYIVIIMNNNHLDVLLENFYKACKKHNLRITPQRVEIFKELIKYNEHPSATRVYQRIKSKYPNISFDTVNRTLQKFVEIGVARIVEDFEDLRRYDGVLENHHHFHCLRCHEIIDINDEKLKEIEIPSLSNTGLIVFESRIIFTGLCPKCHQKNKSISNKNPLGFKNIKEKRHGKQTNF